MKIGTVINYCVNDHKFLNYCVEKIKPFCNDIVISYCSKMFNGKEQDLSKINKFKEKYNEIEYIEFPYENSYSSNPRLGHNRCRLYGYQFLKNKVEKILFLDVDEIIDTDLFIDWINNSEDHKKYKHMNFKCYWYYREPYWQALQHEFCGSFHDINFIDDNSCLTGGERWFWFSDEKYGKKYVTSPENKIMFHHYSWVRTKEEMIQKVTSWGHKNDKNWTKEIETCFAVGFEGKPRKEFNGRTETVHNYDYIKVKPFIEI